MGAPFVLTIKNRDQRDPAIVVPKEIQQLMPSYTAIWRIQFPMGLPICKDQVYELYALDHVFSLRKYAMADPIFRMYGQLFEPGDTHPAIWSALTHNNNILTISGNYIMHMLSAPELDPVFAAYLKDKKSETSVAADDVTEE